MEVVFAVAAVLAYGTVLGLAMTGPRARRLAVLFVAALGLAAPFALREASFAARLVLAGGLSISFMRLVELTLDARHVTATRRIMHATMMVEMRRTRRVPPKLDHRALLQMLAMLLLATLAFLVIARTAPVDRGARALRWFAGIVGAYAGFDGLCAGFRVAWSAIGFELSNPHDHPVKSRTVAEFWGERWNRVVGRWLRVHCFIPLARRRQAHLGLAAAFVASTVIHVYMAWAALDARAGLMWGVFFGMQIPIVFAERALRVSSWPAPAARLWTVGVLGAASPFFVEPLLRGLDAMR